MRLTHKRAVETHIDTVWDRCTDLHTVGGCFPGAAITSVDGDDFTGEVAVKVGLWTLKFVGEGSMTVRDTAHHRAEIRSSGHESRGLGHADLVVVLTLTERRGGGTEMLLESSLAVRGLPAALGSSLAQTISGPPVRKFLSCVGTPVD